MANKTVQLGYALSSEEHRPNDLVGQAWRAEEAGFEFALISDHYHPWIDKQGHSPFVWSVLGGIAQVTEKLVVGTGVTCPILRTHPAIIAQAAATTAAMMRGRFFLGVGTGEALNEHITGERWPALDERLGMLEEAIEVMHLLWSGDFVNVRGFHYTVENARLYTLPDEPPKIMMAAGGEKAALLAGAVADGIIATSPEAELVETFQQGGGEERPRYGQVTVCWAEEEAEARDTAFEYWPIGGLQGQLTQELALPSYFEDAAKSVRKEDIAKIVPCGPDARPIIDQIDKFASAGFDHLYLHQIGPDQEGFIQLCEDEILPHYRRRAAAA